MEEVRQKSWFSKYWGWVIGGGCLTLIIVVVIAVVGVIYKASNAITESEPYTYAFSKVVENETVIDFLGEPIETNGMGSTDYSYTNGSTTANLTIPIKGPNDEGKIVVQAEKINNEWSYNVLYVKIDGEREVINLNNSINEGVLND